MAKTKNEDEYLNNLRHSCAHLLAKAVKDLWPGTHNAIGPAIENGFYQDFDFGEVKISKSDLPKIEAKMRDLLPSWQHFEFKEVTPAEAKKLFKENPYKLELIEEFAQEGKKLLTNDPGNFLDLCKMGHVENPSKELQNFKLLKIAGAYWRGSEKNKMLTRIYGTAFPTQEELDKYLWQQEEAEKRDHKKIGQQMELFMFHETAPGMPYWLPKGVVFYNELVKFWREEHQARGYLEIVSPLINKRELFETSGHWDHYRENMFLSQTEENETYALKPMNCPNAMIVFGSKTRSYRELPLRLSDTDTLHRYELSGTLNGLFRVREFRQDDAHLFVTQEQIKSEFQDVLEITEKFYSIFGIEYRFRLGTRPKDFMGDTKIWDKAEKELTEIMEASGKPYFVAEGEGAFYGPKVDIMMKDALGRDWQTGTIQLDFQMPSRFGITYSDSDGSQKVPVVIHRVVYGSLERFIGILIEHLSGNFPLWLAPVQVQILPIADRHLEYAKTVEKELKEASIRAEIDERSEKLGAKIRDAQMQKVPYMVVIGDKEQEAKTVAVRRRDGAPLDPDKIGVDEFIKSLRIEIVAKTLQS